MLSPAIITSAGYRPGVGDPDFLSWLITFTYFAVAFLCAWAARNELRLARKEHTPERPWFWLVLTALLIVMGFNKQLDLQELILQESHDLAFAAAHGHRVLLKLLSLLTLALTGIATLLALLRYIGHPWRRYLLAFVGLLYLGVFVVVRAADVLPGMHRITTLFYDVLHLIFELGALLMIGASAARAIGRERRRTRAAQNRNLLATPPPGRQSIPA